MSFAWSDFLSLAAGLLRQPSTPGPEEATLRTAISRAYYAAFGSARAFAVDQEEFERSKTGEDHNRLIAHFRFGRDKVRRSIGWDLRQLRNVRNRADYDDIIGNPKALAQSSVDIAGNILNALTTLNTVHPNE